MTASAGRERQREFLERYYGVARGTYDVTRRYYLLGRNAVLDELLAEPWERLVEVGPGTGRNLRLLHERRPQALYGGVDASGAMLSVARSRCPWATLVDGFAEETDIASILGANPDRVLFSYALSMFADPVSALGCARAGLDPAGKVVAVDFGDFGALPGPVARAMRVWLAAFHVSPVSLAQLGPTASHRYGRGHYYEMATYVAT